MVLTRSLIGLVLVIVITVFIVQNKIEIKNKYKDLNDNYPLMQTLESVFIYHAFEFIEDHEIGDLAINHAVFSHPLCEHPVIVLEFKILQTIREFIDRVNKNNRKLVYHYFDKTYDRQNRPLLYFHRLLVEAEYSLGMTEMLPLKYAFALFYQGDCAPLERLPWGSIWTETQYQKWLQTKGQNE